MINEIDFMLGYAGIASYQGAGTACIPLLQGQRLSLLWEEISLTEPSSKDLGLWYQVSMLDILLPIHATCSRFVLLVRSLQRVGNGCYEQTSHVSILKVRAFGELPWSGLQRRVAENPPLFFCVLLC